MVSGQEQQAQKLLSEAIYQEEVNGNLDAAMKAYQLIISDYPDQRNVSARALLRLGVCYEKLGSEQARQTYQDVISKYSDQLNEATMAKDRIARLEAYTAELAREAEKHLKAGNDLFKRWEYDSAIEEYEKAVSSGPNTDIALNARYCIGQSWFRAGKYDEALAVFTRLIEDNPKSNIAPVTELMVAQVKHTIENEKSRVTIHDHPNENTILDPETGITYRKIKSFTGESDIINHAVDLNLSPNGKFLLTGNSVVPMDGTTAPFELIDYNSTGIQPTRGTWSPDGTRAAFFSGDALCVVPLSPETGHTTGPLKKISYGELRWEANPGWSPDGKKLAYHEGDIGDMYIVDADGSNFRQLTATAEIREFGPMWSPDGKTIAYGLGSRSLGLYNIENDKFSEFADVGFRCFPYWSPDGKWIALLWQKLFVYNLNDKSKLEFSPPREVGSFFSWSPEGMKMLFYRSSYNYNEGLKVASASGGPSFEPVYLLTSYGGATWSANNKLMAIQGEDEEGDIAIRIVPLTGGESFIVDLDNLTEGKPFPFNISSDLKRIIFSVERSDGKEDLFVVPFSAEEARTTGPALKIFDGWYMEGANNIIFSLSPDGERVALIHKNDIWIAFTGGDDPIRVDNIPERVTYILWTPDGKALLFHSPSGWGLMENPGPHAMISGLLHEGKKVNCHWRNISISPDNSRYAVLSDDEINIIPFDESRSVQKLNIGGLDLNQCGGPVWSPDSKRIAFIGVKETDDPVSFPEGRYQVYVVPVDGGKPVRIAPDDDSFKYGHSWSPDGKWITFTSMKPVKVRPEGTLWEADFKKIVEKLGK